MPNCDFFAVATDLVEILDFIFAQPGWTLVELASQHERALRTFSATQEIVDGFPGFTVLSDRLHFHLHAGSMGGRIESRRIEFKPGAVPGASFRHDSHGWGLIQLYFGGPSRRSPCPLPHQSQ